MNTEKLMDIALNLANLTKAPQDTEIHVKGENIKKVLFGIDMETPELLLARELGYDCVVTHHPKADGSVVNFAQVMDIQIGKMVEYGVPINKAQKVLRKKQKSIELSKHVSNYDRVSSAARLMKMPYLNIHLPADIITEKIVQDFLDDKFISKPKTKLGEIIDALNEKDVYKNALASPVIRVGSKDDFAGKIVVLMAGGTNGGTDVIKSYFEAGVGTIVCMHIPEDVKNAVEQQNIGNVIVAGHMPSDTIGLVEIAQAWRAAGVEVTTMSGILPTKPFNDKI